MLVLAVAGLVYLVQGLVGYMRVYKQEDEIRQNGI
jgi:hypothetical protein